MKKISRAQGVEVHKLQGEYLSFYIKGLSKGILLNHSYTDEMQTLKDMMKRKDAELQQLSLEQKQRKNEGAGCRQYMHNPKLVTLVLCNAPH